MNELITWIVASLRYIDFFMVLPTDNESELSNDVWILFCVLDGKDLNLFRNVIEETLICKLVSSKLGLGGNFTLKSLFLLSNWVLVSELLKTFKFQIFGLSMVSNLNFIIEATSDRIGRFWNLSSVNLMRMSLILSTLI